MRNTTSPALSGSAISQIGKPHEPHREVSCEVEDLFNGLQGLREQFEALVGAIQPVLAPVQPEPNTGGRPWTSNSAPMAERVQEANRQMYELREYIVQTCTRVRL